MHQPVLFVIMSRARVLDAIASKNSRVCSPRVQRVPPPNPTLRSHIKETDRAMPRGSKVGTKPTRRQRLGRLRKFGLVSTRPGGWTEQLKLTRQVGGDGAFRLFLLGPFLDVLVRARRLLVPLELLLAGLWGTAGRGLSLRSGWRDLAFLGAVGRLGRGAYSMSLEEALVSLLTMCMLGISKLVRRRGTRAATHAAALVTIPSWSATA